MYMIILLLLLWRKLYFLCKNQTILEKAIKMNIGPAHLKLTLLNDLTASVLLFFSPRKLQYFPILPPQSP